MEDNLNREEKEYILKKTKEAYEDSKRLISTLHIAEREFDDCSKNAQQFISATHEQSIKYLKAYYMLSVNNRDEFFDTVLKGKDINPKTELFITTLYATHSRAARTNLEVVTLLKNGLADGAYSRNRTLYEIALYLRVFNKYGFDAVLSFNQNAKNKWILEIPGAAKDFPLGKRNINLEYIKKICDGDGFEMDEWKEMYKNSNDLIHVNQTGTFSTKSTNDEYFAHDGYSIHGIEETTCDSIRLLKICNDLFFESILKYIELTNIEIIDTQTLILLDNLFYEEYCKFSGERKQNKN